MVPSATGCTGFLRELKLTSPDIRRSLFNPIPRKKLEYSKASLESPYGTIVSGWERKDGKIIVRVKIPVNTKATIWLPTDDITKITENGSLLQQTIIIL